MRADRPERASDAQRAGWRIVLFQSAVIGSLLAGAVLVAAMAHAGTSTIGRTWPIAEPDAMAEIEARASQQPPDMAEKFGPRTGWSALQAASLGTVRQQRVRSVVPFYTLDVDISLPDGRLLYPRGYTFNPLAYVSLPQRLIIVHPRDLDWALEESRLTDFILLAAGGEGDADAITLAERHKRALFILEERVKERLGLTMAPVIVRQVGQRLELTEVSLDRPSSRKAAP